MKLQLLFACVLLTCALLTACGHVAFPSGNGRNSRFEWSELSSEHFILDTDADEADGARILATFEALRAADLLAMAGEQQDFAARIRIVAPSPGVYRWLQPHSWAYYVAGGA